MTTTMTTTPPTTMILTTTPPTTMIMTTTSNMTDSTPTVKVVHSLAMLNATLLGQNDDDHVEHSAFTEWFLDIINDYHQVWIFNGVVFLMLCLGNVCSYILLKMEKRGYYVSLNITLMNV